MKNLVLKTAATETEAATYTIVQEERGMVETVIGAITDPVSAADDSLFEKKDVQKVAMGYGAIGFIAGSMIARRRAAAGKAPILKVLG